MPVSSGRCCSKCVHASRPPAEAPMPTIGKRTAARLDGLSRRISETPPAPLSAGILTPGFCVRPAEAGLRRPEPGPGAAGRVRALAFIPVPECFPSLDSAWALPVLLFAPCPEIAFLRVCAFIGSAKSRQTKEDSTLARWGVVFLPMVFELHLAIHFYKETLRQ